MIPSVGCNLHCRRGVHAKLNDPDPNLTQPDDAVTWLTSNDEAFSPRPVRVLLIEDSPLIRKHLVALLEDIERVTICREVDTESAAIAALETMEIDAAVVDLQLREGSGFGVLQHLKAHRPDLLAIVLTNSNTPAMRARSMALGAHHFLDKSSEFERVAELLETLR